MATPLDQRRWVNLPQFALLQFLAVKHNEDVGYAWPGLKHIAGYLKVTKRRVQQLVAELEALGLLRVTRGGPAGVGGRMKNESSRYTLVFSDAADGEEDFTTPDDFDGGEVQPVSRGGEIADRGEVQQVSPDLLVIDHGTVHAAAPRIPSPAEKENTNTVPPEVVLRMKKLKASLAQPVPRRRARGGREVRG